MPTNKYQDALNELKAHKPHGGVQSTNSPVSETYFSQKTAASFIARGFAKFENGFLVFLPRANGIKWSQQKNDESNFLPPLFKKVSNFQKKLPTDRALFMLTKEYQDWRISVLTRDGFKCAKCGSTKKLEVDHIKPYAMYPELRTDVDNGMTLCHDCHVKTETYGGKARKLVSVDAKRN